MKEKKYLIDTTLRDGEQSPGFSFTAEMKTKIAILLDRTGICQIEAGIPAMGSYEKESICRIMDIRHRSRISVWNRMSRKDLDDAFDCKPDIIHISVSVSYTHIYSMLKKNKAWLQKELKDCVVYAQDRGFEVTVGFADASRADLTFIITLANMLSSLEVKSLRLADTVGVLTPARTREMMEELKNHTDMKIGIHAHNDFGMAVANSLEAAKAGAAFIDTTLFGIGERAGNCDMAKFIKAAGQLYDIRPAYADAILVEEKAKRMIFHKEME